ncbi:Rab3 GTPase-activating protein catalytic subunit, partial [Modicella reniformis]
MESEDQDNFEFIDYTTSGPWERFIVQIENCLKQWGLVYNSYGVFNPNVMASTEGAVNLDQELALALKDESHTGDTVASLPVGAETTPTESLSMVYQHNATITLEDASYTLSYRYHPAKARIAAGVERIDLDFLPTSLEGQEHHILHRWTALTHILVLSPASNTDSTIIDLGNAKLLLSSFAIAFQNTGCNIPVFVPTGQTKNKTYTGLSMQPLLSHTRDSELGLEETAEDQAIEVRFNTVVVPYPPAYYTNLSGILDLFIERMGIENELAAMEGGLSGSEGCSQEVKEQIYVSALFSYQLDNRYDDEWRQWSDAADGSERRPDEGPSTGSIPRLPVGPIQDPLKSLQLVARFASAPSTVYLDSKNLTEMDASLANIWIMKALFKTDDSALMCGILEDVISSWSIESSTGSDKNRSSEKEQSSYVSLLQKGARIIQGSVVMVDIVDVENIVKDLFSKPSHSLPSQPLTTNARHSRRSSESSVERVVSAAELGLHFRHATTVPQGSFLWRMLQHLVDVMSPNSHITYPTSFMGFLKVLWADLLKQLSEHWDKKEMIPWVQVLKEPANERSEGVDSTPDHDKSDPPDMEANLPSIDLRFNLLHQKLSMINCCIARDRAIRQENDLSQSATADDTSSSPSTTSSASSSKPISLPGALPSSSITSFEPRSVTGTTITPVDDGSGAEQGDDSDEGVETSSKDSLGSLSGATMKLELTPSSEQNQSPSDKRNPSQHSSLQPKNELEGFKGLILLETGSPLVVPKLQNPSYMTEDMIQQQEDLFESLGLSPDAAKTRAHAQSAQLLSDMSAFKASNPGCVLGDFIRWHSPKDWDEEKHQMSARMAESGNIWQELWE